MPLAHEHASVGWLPLPDTVAYADYIMTTQNRPTAPSGTSPASSPDMTGIIAAVSAFLIWGLVNPVYFKSLPGVDPLEVLAHRVIWTVVLAGGALIAFRGISPLINAMNSWRKVSVMLTTTLLISINWGIFIWGVGDNRLIEISLGYFINPLMNVVLGVLFLSERLSRAQISAVALAAAGVMALIVSAGTFPWVALTLAVTFGLYGLVRKKAAVDPVVGLVVETLILLPLMLAYLAWLFAHGQMVFTTQGWTMDLLLIAAGPMTAIPLILFNMAAARLKLSTIGLIQYIGPTAQFLLGVLVYGEIFTQAHAIAFACIWAALILYSADTFRTYRSSRA